jgi:hypothetical protein
MALEFEFFGLAAVCERDSYADPSLLARYAGIHYVAISLSTFVHCKLFLS